MLRVEDCALLLLAAGKSTRFGDVRSKLDQNFLSKPLGLHAAAALKDMPFKDRLAIVSHLDLDYSAYGFTVLQNRHPDRGMSSSVSLGVERARELGATSVLVALADMPRVTQSHVNCLFQASSDEMSVVASSDGKAPKPPALFGAGRFDHLLHLDGDNGARDLIRGGRHVITSAAELVDIDTPQDLAELRALLQGPERHC